MSYDKIFFISPPPSSDYCMELEEYISKDGHSLRYTEKSVFLQQEMKSFLLAKGITELLTTQQLNEEVLADNTPRSALLDILRYKIDRCAATQSILIIDPYLFPSKPDTDYLSDFCRIFEGSIKKCTAFEIATLSNRNGVLEQQMRQKIININPNIQISIKYTDVFHDRFWIADNIRGVFVGTSLNGIGKKYAVIDWLQEEDTKEIVGRYKQLP